MADKNKTNLYPQSYGDSHQNNGKTALRFTGSAGWLRFLVMIIFVIMVMAPVSTPGAMASVVNAPSQDFGRELGRRQPSVIPHANQSTDANGTNQLQQPLDPVAQTARTVMISVDSDGNEGGNNPSYDAAMTADAKMVAFDSTASNIMAGLTEPQDSQNYTYSQIYLRNLAGPTAVTTQLSLNSSDPTKGASGDSEFPAISADGKWVAWRSCAPDLVSVGAPIPCSGNRDNSYQGSNYQIYLRNLTSNTTILVSIDATLPNTPGNQASGYFKPPEADYLKQSKGYYPGYIYTPLALSANGGLVVYQSTATNLVTGLPAYDPNKPISRIFLYDAVSQTTSLISKPGEDCGAEYPRISGNGRYIVYSSCITINLPGFHQDGVYQVYLVDRDSLGNGTMIATTKTISGGYDNHPGNGQSLYPTISADGNIIVFRSSSDNLDIGFPIFTTPEIFLVDRTKTPLTAGLISRRGQIAGNAEATFSAISSDGHFVAFASHANNLVPNDTNIDCPPPDNPSNCPDVFIVDNVTSFVKRVSLADTVPVTGGYDGPQANQGSYYPAISADGVYVAFDSNATNLTPGISVPSGFSNVYLHYRGIPGTEPDENFPQINVVPSSLVYGNKDTTPQTLTIKNIGFANLNINSLSFIGNQSLFKTDSETCTAAAITPGKTCTVTVSYHQHYPFGVMLGAIVIHSNDPANQALAVSLRGGSGSINFLAWIRKK